MSSTVSGFKLIGVFLVVLFFVTSCYKLEGQGLYFPPVLGDQWETLSPESLGYCQERIEDLYSLLQQENSKAFILLKDGKIVLEKYFDGFTMDSVWYWASAGKSLTAFLVGLAQQEGKLSIEDKVSDYLGKGWTSAPAEKEDLITIRNQLTMTSGLDDTQGDRDCTEPVCLRYLQDAGKRWAYHNAPYTLLDKVIEKATGQSINIFAIQRLRQSTGITGSYLKLGFNNVYFSRPRSMARFGLLMLNKGRWGTTQVMADSIYFESMINTSQQLNPSYGYLWWLNGKSHYMVPQVQFRFPGFLIPSAPEDCYAALGKDGQMLHIVPSQNLIWVRMGNSPDNVPVPFLLAEKIWKALNRLECSVSVQDNITNTIKIYPNPANHSVQISGTKKSDVLIFRDAYGNFLDVKDSGGLNFDVSHLSSGLYIVEINGVGGKKQIRWVKI